MVFGLPTLSVSPKRQEREKTILSRFSFGEEMAYHLVTIDIGLQSFPREMQFRVNMNGSTSGLNRRSIPSGCRHFRHQQR